MGLRGERSAARRHSRPFVCDRDREPARFAERFRGVQIDQLDWPQCLDRYDGPGAVFYLDPPYHPQARGRDRGNGYRHDLDAAGHERLLARAVELRASVLISGYPHLLYERELASAGFERHEHPHYCTASRCLTGRGPRTEVVWRRLAPGAAERLPLWQASSRAGRDGRGRG